MAREYLVALGAGVASALLNLSPLMSSAPGSLILTALGPLPPLAVGFAMGLYPGALATGIAAVIIAATTKISLGGWFVLTNVLPTVSVLYMALQSQPGPAGARTWYPSGYVLAWLTVLGGLYIVGVAVYFSGTEGGYARIGYELLHEVLARLAVGPPDAGGGANEAATQVTGQIEAFAQRIAPYLPGVWITCWEILFVANAVLAQGLMVRFGRNIRPPSTLATVALPRWLGGVGAAAIVVSFIPGGVGTVALNVLMALCIPFFFLGLAVIHALARRWRGPGASPFLRAAFVTLFYFIILTMVWPAFVLVGIGIVEMLANIRRRLGRNGTEEEEV
jgi:hypothetical protein